MIPVRYYAISAIMNTEIFMIEVLKVPETNSRVTSGPIFIPLVRGVVMLESQVSQKPPKSLCCRCKLLGMCGTTS